MSGEESEGRINFVCIAVKRWKASVLSFEITNRVYVYVSCVWRGEARTRL